ncbi:Rrf2 family transcriptional regulator [Desulfobulbus rhabdoformis]|jgi:Rrf2 family protein|uniref:RrF2 family transcriptional regulator n=1 Tax=Desulfobulbus rhabdoformis TaxID=34032 RepID=UPI0019626124|nr:Rrf2 family transcriptional regulator [Desulfobulbus rhabdoformis]MBM9613709.1 Rrf2 family transcriptional regulator [Desulfobulbus rhabdoformis]
MRLTRAAEYAIRCIIYLSRRGRGVLTSRQEIAAQADIPIHFLAKIAQDLAKAGLIEIRQGAKGGFLLSKLPAAITLLDVVETMIGEIYLNDCIARPAGCKRSYHCAVHRVWLDARDQLRDTLRRVTFDQLITDTSCLPYPKSMLESKPLETNTSARGDLQ